ncbi:MAG: hypothetical protein WCT22_02765 [Patescibacteria group bacterium]
MNGLEACFFGGALTAASGLIFWGLSRLRSPKSPSNTSVLREMTPEEVAHQHAMEAKHGDDHSGRKWLTMTVSKAVFGSDHPAGKKS